MTKIITTIIAVTFMLLTGCSRGLYQAPTDGGTAELKISNHTDAQVDVYTYKDSRDCRGTILIPVREITTLWGSKFWGNTISQNDSASIIIPADREFTTALVLLYPYQRCDLTSTFTPLAKESYELNISANVYSCRMYMTKINDNKKEPINFRKRTEKEIFFENDPACE